MDKPRASWITLLITVVPLVAEVIVNALTPEEDKAKKDKEEADKLPKDK